MIHSCATECRLAIMIHSSANTLSTEVLHLHLHLPGRTHSTACAATSLFAHAGLSCISGLKGCINLLELNLSGNTITSWVGWTKNIVFRVSRNGLS